MGQVFIWPGVILLLHVLLVHIVQSRIRCKYYMHNLLEKR